MTTDELLATGKIFIWDIETTDFKANFGHMLMWAGKFVGEDTVHYARIDDTRGFTLKRPDTLLDDSYVVQTVVDKINEADAIVHHYGDRFDLRFVNTRALINGILPPAPPTTIDTWKVARSGLAMTSNRLASLAETFCAEDNQKGGLSKTQWQLASLGHKPTLDAMLEYCIQDVLSTEELYLKLRPIIKNHPYIGPAGTPDERRSQCPACGSHSTQKHDIRRTKLYEVYRSRCMNCGTAFETGRKKIAP